MFVERLRTLLNSDKSIEIDFALSIMRSYNQVSNIIKCRNRLETNKAVTNIYMFLTLFHSDIVIGNIILPVIRLLSCKAQGHNDLSKPSKPCHVGIHWKALVGHYSIRGGKVERREGTARRYKQLGKQYVGPPTIWGIPTKHCRFVNRIFARKEKMIRGGGGGGGGGMALSRNKSLCIGKELVYETPDHSTFEASLNITAVMLIEHLRGMNRRKGGGIETSHCVLVRQGKQWDTVHQTTQH